MRIFCLSATLCLLLRPALCFLVAQKQFPPSPRLGSTPFESGYYDFDDASNPFDDQSSLAAPPDTKLVLGLNKYSHDTSLCAANAETGEVLFAISKERLTRRKHDSGNVAVLVEKCLECLDLDFDAIQKVVVNNHHHRVLPMEENRAHMEWECGLHINGGAEVGYDDEENLLGDAQQVRTQGGKRYIAASFLKEYAHGIVYPCYIILTLWQHELSHHLAHAYSVATQSPFPSGMVVVMDGMGETYRAMLNAEMTGESSYTSDLSFGLDSFQCIPSDLKERSQYSRYDYREAESVYVFEKKEAGMDLRVRVVDE